jgi:hypothetical protein
MLRDIKGPLSLAYQIPIAVIVGILVCLVVLGLVLFFLAYRKRRIAETRQRSAHEIAEEQLEALRRKDLIRQGKFKEYYSEISDIVRHYLEQRFQLKAPEMTTEEFLLYVRDYGTLVSAHKSLLKDFLGVCDLVKFARYTPHPDEAEAVYGAAKRFIDQTREEVSVR